MMSQSLSQLQITLQFVNGPLAQQSLQINGRETWIGSDSRSHVYIPDPSIQPWHACLISNNGRLLIQSYQQSLIAVNKQIISDTAYIQNGDLVSLGQTDITFRVIFPQQNDTLSSSEQNSLESISDFSQQQSASTTSQQSKDSLSLAHTETTRYLCAAAHIDETFRHYVLKNIVREEHQALGETYGVDITPIVKCCFAAEQRSLMRDSILTGILLLAILGPLLLTPWLELFIIGLAWLVVTLEKKKAYYGPIMTQLTKGKFKPDTIESPLDPELDRKLKESFNTQGRNVIVYSGYSPFAGAGSLIERWSFAIDITQGKQTATEALKPSTFHISEMYDYVACAIEALGLSDRSDVHLEDKLYVNGQEIRDDTRFLNNHFARPNTQVDTTCVREFMENPTEDIRYYKCIHITSWRGELVLSIFFRLVMAGKNLFIETDFLVLPPLKKEYYSIDRLQPTLTARKFWELAKQSFFPTLPLLLYSPTRVLSWILKDWFAQREEIRIRRFIHENPAFDYGASTSLRQFASDSNYRLFFEKLDQEMYTKIIQHQMLESIVSFLDARNIDTSELKKRQEAIQNNSTLIIGSSISGTGIAIGSQAQATNKTQAEKS
jgi:hypothetical protein